MSVFAAMSNREIPDQTGVKVEGKGLKKEKMTSRSNGRETEFVYVNSAFVGSVNNVNANMNERGNRNATAPAPPITEVYREQYWACSRWPYTQRILAVAVGVLLGALIGLTISLVLREVNDNNVIGPIFTRQHIAPD